VDPIPPAPKRRPRPPRRIQDLPLFAAKGPRPTGNARPPVAKAPNRVTFPDKKVIKHADMDVPEDLPTQMSRKQPLPRSWASPSVWLPIISLAMLLAGVWMLIPTRTEESDLLPKSDRTLPTVVIDAGHGGQDSGAMAHGLREKDLTLDTALRLEKHLRAQGFPVVLTRRDDRYLELFDRAHIANRIPRALFVSIHFNDSTTGSGDGVETFYAQQKAAFRDDGWTFASLIQGKPEPAPVDQGASFATSIQASIVGELGVTDRGAKPRQLAVVRLTRCPAVLVEGGFINNPAEARKLASPEYREKLATAVCDGVILYYQEREMIRRNQELAGR
jgi:N-acetylmuramoyl-L-alanine amidase